MTEQELQISVCELLGWKFLRTDTQDDWNISPQGRHYPARCQPTHGLPPLTLDLMHEAEKTLTFAEGELYAQELAHIHGYKNATVTAAEDEGFPNAADSIREISCSDKTQRATAFIAVKQKGAV